MLQWLNTHLVKLGAHDNLPFHSQNELFHRCADNLMDERQAQGKFRRISLAQYQQAVYTFVVFVER